jgi:hypothetical protein
VAGLSAVVNQVDKYPHFNRYKFTLEYSIYSFSGVRLRSITTRNSKLSLHKNIILPSSFKDYPRSLLIIYLPLPLPLVLLELPFVVTMVSVV